MDNGPANKHSFENFCVKFFMKRSDILGIFLLEFKLRNLINWNLSESNFSFCQAFIEIPYPEFNVFYVL